MLSYPFHSISTLNLSTKKYIHHRNPREKPFYAELLTKTADFSGGRHSACHSNRKLQRGVKRQRKFSKFWKGLDVGCLWMEMTLISWTVKKHVLVLHENHRSLVVSWHVTHASVKILATKSSNLRSSHKKRLCTGSCVALTF